MLRRFPKRVAFELKMTGSALIGRKIGSLRGKAVHWTIRFSFHSETRLQASDQCNYECKNIKKVFQSESFNLLKNHTRNGHGYSKNLRYLG